MSPGLEVDVHAPGTVPAAVPPATGQGNAPRSSVHVDLGARAARSSAGPAGPGSTPR